MQVINAALALAAKPQSKLAQENMELFKEQWEKQVRVLTDAVDDITSIDDFLAVSGNGEALRSRLLTELVSGSQWCPRVVESLVFGRIGVGTLHPASAECDVKIEQGMLAQGEKVSFQV